MENKTTAISTPDVTTNVVEFYGRENNFILNIDPRLPLSMITNFNSTAMGPLNACSYANIAMGEIDHKAKHCGPIKPSQWWRYRVDIFDLWQQRLARLNSFYSETKLNVLDVTFLLVDGFI